MNQQIDVTTHRLIHAERAYQVHKWDGDHDHSVGEWVAILTALAMKLPPAYAHVPVNHVAALEMVQLMTTAVVAVTQHKNLIEGTINLASSCKPSQRHIILNPMRIHHYMNWLCSDAVPDKVSPVKLPYNSLPPSSVSKQAIEAAIRSAQGIETLLGESDLTAASKTPVSVRLAEVISNVRDALSRTISLRESLELFR